MIIIGSIFFYGYNTFYLSIHQLTLVQLRMREMGYVPLGTGETSKCLGEQ